MSAFCSALISPAIDPVTSIKKNTSSAGTAVANVNGRVIVPVVSTTIGIEGLDVQDGVHYLCRDSAQDQADAIGFDAKTLVVLKRCDVGDFRLHGASRTRDTAMVTLEIGTDSRSL